MKKRSYLFYLSVLTFLMACQAEQPGIHRFDLSESDLGYVSMEESKAFEHKVLHFEASVGRDTLPIYTGSSAIDWAGYKYLVLETWHDNEHSAILNIDFFKTEGAATQIIEQGEDAPPTPPHTPTISPKIGLLPGLKTQVIFPLSYLDGQDIFLDRFPRQLKGTVLGSRLAPDKIDRVRLRVSPAEGSFQTRLEIAAVYLTKELPEPLPAVQTPIVDSFGQWAVRDWPGKVKTDTQLVRNLQDLAGQREAGDFPTQWSRYGGWKGKRFTASGFFRTEHDGQRWWLVDPEGFAFLSAGMDCVGNNASGVVSGQEDVFSWLPPSEDSLFAGCYSTRGENMQLVNFFKANLMRAFGSDWHEQWQKMTLGLLKEMHFNTIGNWSDIKLAQERGFPYVLPMRNFPGTAVQLFRDFPDVYADEFQINAERFARQLESLRDDPYLIGYFLANEPHWAFGYHNLAFEMFATNQTSYTKSVCISWLREKYGRDISRLNEAWELDLANFAALAPLTFEEPPSPVAEADFRAFSEAMVKKYIDVVCDEVEKVDPNHLNLGMRYAWISSDLLYLAGERFDAFSINGYSYPAPPETAEIARRSGKPILIGEFHFGAVDRGLPATGIRGVRTQAERAQAYRYYVEQGFSRPEIIGLHYFQWIDQPVFGRFDGENYNIGFLDITHQPYPELMEAAKITHERLYEIASRRKVPVDTIPAQIPAIYY